MIEYSVNPAQSRDRWLMYFAGEGSWGSAEDIVVLDVTELDGHYTEVIETLSDWQLPDFMRWYVDNQTHDQMRDDDNYVPCLICEQWDTEKTEAEIQADLK